MGEELGARGEREGSASEKEEGAGEDLPRRARHPPAPWRSRSARGRPAPPRPWDRPGSRPESAKCAYPEDRSPAPWSAFERRDTGPWST